MNRELNFIGKIKTPYNSLEECPLNIDLNGPQCTLFINEDLKAELRGLKQDQNIMILYWLGDNENKLVKINNSHRCPHGARKDLGTFAKRSPRRPNPIGVAITPIKQIDIGNGIIVVNGLDCLNNTNLIDIKPAIKLENNN